VADELIHSVGGRPPRVSRNRYPDSDEKQNDPPAAGFGFVASVGIAALQPVGDLVRVVASVPAAAALVGAMFQMPRDQMAHDRARSLQDAQNGANAVYVSISMSRAFCACSRFSA
jgi:hypothetical protein